MRSRTTAGFRSAFSRLPPDVRTRAREAYRLFRDNPNHPSLRFRRVHPVQPIYSARVSLGYRAVGIRSADEIIWFWIGAHDEYERLLQQRRKA